MKYTVLASGSKGNCTLIEYKEHKILIDCGTTKKYMVSSLEDLDVEIGGIDALFITHNHSDHVKQVKHFKDHPIFSPEPILDASIVTPYQKFNFKEFEVLPIPTSHDAGISVGYVISTSQSRLVYITDTGYIKEQDLEIIKGADYYILESNHDPVMLMKTQRPYIIKQRILSDSGHLSNADAATILSKIVTTQTKEIVLAHLSLEANSENLALETSQKSLQQYDVEIKVARQFEPIQGGNRNEKEE